METTKKPTASKNLNLDRIKVIPFLTAIQENDRSHISKSITQKQFEELCDMYMKATKPPPGNIEKRVESYGAKMMLIKACFIVFDHYPADEEMMEVLRSRGYKIERETFWQDIKVIEKKCDHLDFKWRNEKAKLPKKKKNNPKEQTSIYDMLTGLSSGLELSLNFETMTVGEFMSWKAQLKRKHESLKKRTHGQ